MTYALYSVADRSLPRTGAEELAAGSDLAAGATDGAGVDFVRSAESEAFARPVVEGRSDAVAASFGEIGERGAFGQILADKTVRIFVGASFPGVMGSGEVDGRIEGCLERFVAMKLDPVVRGDGSHGMRFVGEQGDEPSIGVLDGWAEERPDSDDATLALNGGSDAGLARAVHGVGFPVTEAAARGHNLGTVLDHPLTREPAAAVLSTVAFTPSFVRPPQVRPEGSAVRSVSPDPEIDRLVAHDVAALQPAPPDDLLRTPTPLEQSSNRCKVNRSVASIAARAAAAPVGHLLREGRPIRAVMRRGVALHLTRYGARVPPQYRGDLPRREALLPQRRDMISFLRA